MTKTDTQATQLLPCRETFEAWRKQHYDCRTGERDWLVWQAALSTRATPSGHADTKAIAEKALLLAARWFKMCFDDETLDEHPPSKTDLAGMFDAMQEARREISRLESSHGVGEDVVEKVVKAIASVFIPDGVYNIEEGRKVEKAAKADIAAYEESKNGR